jgi:hypothetical protein
MDYFDEQMVRRQRLLWTIATRRQLERWEPFVAAHQNRLTGRGQLESADIWAAEIEHHFALIAARNLLRALDLKPVTNVSVDPVMRTELIEGRDLHEHWVDNLPVFMVTPRVERPPRASGRAFATRNPDRGPYWWLGWGNKTGAQLLPNVSAPAVHDLLDAVETEVLAADESLRDFVPLRVPSPWIHENNEWWPKPQGAEGGPSRR